MQSSTRWVSIILCAACGCGKQLSSGSTSAQPTNKPPASSTELVARFANAAGLPVGERVVIGGLNIGRVTRIEPDNPGALVWFELRNELEVWSNAILTRKASSTLGDYYLELDPGTGHAGGATFRIGPRCPHYASRVREEARRCREVTKVVDSVPRAPQ